MWRSNKGGKQSEPTLVFRNERRAGMCFDTSITGERCAWEYGAAPRGVAQNKAHVHPVAGVASARLCIQSPIIDCSLFFFYE